MSPYVVETEIGADQCLQLRVPAHFPPGCKVRVVIESLTGDAIVDRYRPRTEFGRRLVALRRAYIEDGGKLMTADEIGAEVRRRRGGVADDW